MGLDFDNSNAHWGYGGFMRFRERLAKEIGIELRNMEGFTDAGISWKKIIDPIVYLLYHSDCDGKLTPQECKEVAPRLKVLVSDWDNDDYDKINALLLAKGMEKCAIKKKDLEFI